MSFFVYALCALTSFVCCGLLFGHYRRERGKLLLYSALAFFCFALANVLLFIDLIVLPQIDLRLLRNALNLVGVLVLIFAIVNHGRETA